MRKYARVLVYIVVALLGGLLVYFQLFPTFENKVSSYVIIAIGAILLIDGIRSIIRYIRSL